jgi:hypothetical protein
MTDDRPTLLDLYCCAGGAAMGYHRAGFRVIGADIEPRPRYPFEFVQADALDVLRKMIAHRGCVGERDHSPLHTLSTAVAVHASPPCQKDNPLTKGTNGANGWGRRHRSWTAETRGLLDRLGLPYVIEQPAGSGEIRRDLMLCMAYFDLYGLKPPPWVQRHRDFELSGFEVRQPRHVAHKGYVRGMRHGVVREGPYVAAYGKGGGKATVAEMQHALGIDWTDVREELTEAIPPAYTEYIGRTLYAQVTKGRLDHSGQSKGE